MRNMEIPKNKDFIYELIKAFIAFTIIGGGLAFGWFTVSSIFNK